ncbi:hypothetical protein MMAG44476_28804 [Mycolicibacterium mageritense DSM 44476 = CIP 104973]|nr:hypothetical protein BN978_01510 [Mycolicibacterium mageritense DSM 44476 = CIP 104973]
MAAFSADAALLHPAERCGRVADQTAVEPDHARFDLRGNAQAPRQVTGVNISNQPEFGVVGERDGLAVGLETDNGRDRAENLVT